MTRIALTVTTCLLAAGCFLGNKDLADGPYCEETATLVSLEELTELGFSGADLLALAEGSFEQTLTWTEDGSSTALTVDVVHADGEVRYVASTAVYPDDGGTTIDIGVECEDYVEVDVTIDITTADGELAESLETSIASFYGTEVRARESLAPEDIQGSYEYTGMDPSEYDELDLDLSVELDEAGCSGEMTVTTQGCDDDCDGNECTCWASNDVVAIWPEEE